MARRSVVILHPEGAGIAEDDEAGTLLRGVHFHVEIAELIKQAALFRAAGPMKREEGPHFMQPHETITENDPRFRRFRVNLFVGDGCKTCAPVVVEDDPQPRLVKARRFVQAQFDGVPPEQPSD